MPTAVLLSGGLDSAVLLADEAASGDVHPVYVAAGLAWEAAERAFVSAFLARAPLNGRAHPLISLSVDMHDTYAATHWAMEGRPPDYHTPDEDVYLPGRNVILLSKAAVYCAAAKVERLVIGTLAHNPFPDATPEFRAAMARALSLGLDWPLAIEAPYANSEKAEVIRRGAALGVPLELTLSCMNPPSSESVIRSSESVIRSSESAVRSSESAIRSSESAIRNPQSAIHCGLCSKCRERHDAFVDAGVPDPTTYASTINLR